MLKGSDLHCVVSSPPSDIQLGSLVPTVLVCGACKWLCALSCGCPHNELRLGIHLVHCALAKSACSTARLCGGLWSA